MPSRPYRPYRGAAWPSRAQAAYRLGVKGWSKYRQGAGAVASVAHANYVARTALVTARRALRAGQVASFYGSRRARVGKFGRKAYKKRSYKKRSYKRRSTSRVHRFKAY